MRKKNKRKRAKAIQAAKPPMIIGDPMPVQWAASMPTATTAVITTPTPEPIGKAEHLAFERHTAAMEAMAAPYATLIPADKLANIQSTAKIKAVELRTAAIVESKPAAWLDEQYKTIQAAVETQLKRTANTFRSNGMKNLDNKTIEASFCTRLGVPESQMKKSFTAQELDASTSRDYRDVSLQQVLLAAAAENGYNINVGERINGSNIRGILKAAFLQAAASTHTLTTLLSGTANRVLLSGFDAIPQTWREVCEVTTVRDFKASTAFRLTASLEYEELGPGGEIHHGEVGQESYSIQAKTYARMLSLTRTDIINDDLGAFNDLRKRLGMGGALALNKAVWTTWLAAANGGEFWTDERGNLESGAGSAFGTAGLSAALAAYQSLTSADGNLIHLNPDRVLVPPDLEAAALEMFAATEIRDSTADTKAGTANIHHARFRPVVVPELSSSSYTGYSTTGWWLLCNPELLSSAVVCFLNGAEAPTIESTDADFDTLGLQFRGYHDFGVAMSEYRASVCSAGV